MASLKISQLTSGVPAQAADVLPIDRAGVNFSVTAASIAALAAGSFTFGTFLQSHGYTYGGDYSGTTSLRGYGCNVTSNALVGTNSQFFPIEPTATEPPYLEYRAGTGAQTFVGASDNQTNQNGAAGAYAITLGTLAQAIYRVQLPTVFPPQRVWIGMGASACFATSGAAMKSDTPNAAWIGFRYTVGVDTYWTAYAGTSSTSGAQTTVATTVAPDNAGHIFAIQSVGAGTSVNFYIDGGLVANIATNLPANTVQLCNLVGNDNTSNDTVKTSVYVAYMGWQSTV